MARFQYRALTPSGEISEGIMEAPTRDAAIAHLRATNHLPIKAVPVQEAAPAAVAPAGRPAARPSRWAQLLRHALPWRRRVGRSTVAMFTRQLHTLLDAGLPADRALSVIAETTPSEPAADMIADLRGQVRGGTSLSDAMAGHPAVFNPFYRSMVTAGEAGGTLPSALDALADHLERAGQLAASVRTALIYPAVLVLAACVSVVVLLTLVVPQFELLFREAAQEIPIITQIVIEISRLLRSFGWLIPPLGIVVWFGLRTYWRRPGVRARRDVALLRLPVIGSLIAQVEIERFARALATLLGNGVPLPQALELTQAAASNQGIANALAAAAEQVRQGRQLAQVLRESKVVPPLAIQLIQVGEEGSRLEGMLLKLADAYASDVDVKLKRLVGLLEPTLILLIGLVVAVIVVSLFSAIIGVNAVAL